MWLLVGASARASTGPAVMTHVMVVRDEGIVAVCGRACCVLIRAKRLYVYAW